MLSFAEVCRQQKSFNFAASKSGDAWVYAWVHKRGALDKGSSDGGHDLVVMRDGGFPQVVISGAKSLSTPSFDGERFLVAKDRTEAVIGSVSTLQVRTWFTLTAGETFDGASSQLDLTPFNKVSDNNNKREVNSKEAPVNLISKILVHVSTMWSLWLT